jgi:hypothetical protein
MSQETNATAPIITTERRRNFLDGPWFPALLVFFFLMHGSVENYGLVPAGRLLLLLGKYLVALGLLMIIARLFFCSWTKGAYLVFLLFFVQFFFIHGYEFLRSTPQFRFLMRYSILIPMLLALFLVLAIYLKKIGHPSRILTRYLNLVLLVLIAFESVQWMTQRPRPAVPAAPPVISACDTCSKPDIYLIVADEYAGKQQLADLFGFDNSHFERALQTRGFFVVPDSRSNYNLTEYSIASSFNLSYLDVDSFTTPRDVARCFEAIKKNMLVDAFRRQGYRFYNLSIFEVKGQTSIAKDVFDVFHPRMITWRTFTEKLDRDIGYHLPTLNIFRASKPDYYIYHRNTLQQLDSTRRLARSPSQEPRFIYTHLDMPHHPFYFDKDGKPRSKMELSYRFKNSKPHYLGYLQYANKVYLDLIDDIRRHASRPPIILFMGDHGFRGFFERQPTAYYMMTINAIYLPSGRYGAWYPGITHINHFRTLLNTQFGQKLPLLKDSSTFVDYMP